MIDTAFKFLGTVFVVTAVIYAFRPNSNAPKTISALTNGVATMQRAATGA